MHMGQEWRIIPWHIAVCSVNLLKRLLSSHHLATAVDELNGAPDFANMAKAVIAAGQAREGVTVEELAGTLSRHHLEKRLSKQNHGNDAAVELPTLFRGANRGGKVTAQTKKHYDLLCKGLKDKEIQQQASPEIVQLVCKEGYQTALDYAYQQGAEQGKRSACQYKLFICSSVCKPHLDPDVRQLQPHHRKGGPRPLQVAIHLNLASCPLQHLKSVAERNMEEIQPAGSEAEDEAWEAALQKFRQAEEDRTQGTSLLHYLRMQRPPLCRMRLLLSRGKWTYLMRMSLLTYIAQKVLQGAIMMMRWPLQ